MADMFRSIDCVVDDSIAGHLNVSLLCVGGMVITIVVFMSNVNPIFHQIVFV